MLVRKEHMSFYVVEGPNGSGKTSLIKNLASKGIKTLSSPDGTPLAKMLRPACRGVDPWEDIDKFVQFLLFSAARYDEYLRCVKDQNDIVVADRWWTSTYVYQCVLGTIPIELLQYTLHPQEKIDGVILLDGRDEVLIQRTHLERTQNTTHGNCSWTQDINTMKRIIQIYRHELPVYLTCCHQIPVYPIDTTQLTPRDVTNKTLEIIQK